MTKNKLYQECLLKPASLICDGHLHGISTVRHLLRLQAPLHPDDQCQAALDCFLRNNEIDALPVVDSTGKPIGLLYRKDYVEFFSGLYAREVFGRRTLRELLEYDGYERIEPVIVEDTYSIEDVARIIINAGMQYMVTGFIVASEGTYLGIANGHDLLSILTQRKQAELYYLAHYDALTGIPNRALLLDRLEIALHDAKRNGHLTALLFVDVDRFKQINDSLGHAAGDAALRQIVARLKAVARSSDTVARLGGDEFVILAEHVDNENDVDAIAHRLIKSMQEPLELLGHALVATISVGCAIYPIDDQLSSPLLAKADAAMYKAKSEGRNNFRRYSPDSSVYNPAIIMLENDLRQAIEQGQLILHYQPQVDLISQTIKGFEALVRWHHPVRGLVSPAQFIPLAEECGLIVPMGEWVLRHALKQLRMWLDDGLGPCRMSINISARQIQESGFTIFLEQQLLEHSINPNLVELELTESILMKDVEAVLDTLLRIKALGVSLAVDDFGTGFSSLSYLQRFPIDRLKIDQSFVRNIESTPANESIARAIVALAHSLSLETIAEGIENPAEQKILERLQCTEGQGYLFARPLPASEVMSWAGLKSPPGSELLEQPCRLHSRSCN